jgi:hypothetical protein
MWMNRTEIEIEVARAQAKQDVVLVHATTILKQLQEETDAHSDGWSTWMKPAKAAEKLMQFIRKGGGTEAELKKACVPIKAFYTRIGRAAGMVLPAGLL